MGTLVKINQTAGAKGSGRLVKISEKNDPVQPAALPKYQSRRETGTARPQIAPSSGKKDDGYRPSNALVQSAYDGLREGALPAATQFGRLDLPTGAATERKGQRQTPQKIQREETAQRLDDLRRQELEAERRQLTLPGRVYNEETTAQNRARVQEIDRELSELRPSSRYNPLMSAAGAVQKGLGQVAQFGGDTLAMAEDAVYAPFELVSGLKLGDLSDEGFFNRWAADIRRENEGVAQFYQRNMELGGKPAEILEGLGASAVAAAPQAALALVTGGGSLGVQTSSGLARAAAAELRPGLGTTVGNAVEAMAKNPQFWTAFAQVVGGGYEEAIQDQRDRGETDENLIRTKAALYAVGNGLLNAAVEMGGGIQTLPAQLQGGKSAWRSWVEGMVDEGKEEVVQGILQRSLQNAIYQQDNPLFSTTDEGAILNPKTAAEEFAGGAAVGGILGGGQALILSRRAARPTEEYLTEREGILRDLATQKVQGEMELARRRAAPRELIRPETARELLATLGERGERAFRAAYQQESGLLPSFREFAKAYNQGLRGEPKTAVEPGRSIDTMAGYFAGQNDAAAQSAAPLQTQKTAPTRRAGGNSRLTSDDLSDYLRVGKKQSVRNAKQAAVDAGESIILTDNIETQNYIQQALTGETTSNTPKAYGKVGQAMADDIFAASDGAFDVEGWYLELVPSDIKHAFNQHAAPKREGNIALTEQDFLNIPAYIDTYDDILACKTYSSGDKEILLGKKINGYSVIVEVVSGNRRSLHFKNMWGLDTDTYERRYEKRIATSRPGRSDVSANDPTGAYHSDSSSPIISAQGQEVNPVGGGIDTVLPGAYNGGSQTNQGGISDAGGEAEPAAGQGVPGADVWGEAEGADAGGTGAYSQFGGKIDPKEGPAQWAREHLIERPSTSASRAFEAASRYVPDVFVVDDASIKSRNSDAWALTSRGKVYISDSVPEMIADIVGYHEVVHAQKQRGSQEYDVFLSQVGERLDHQSDRSDLVFSIILQSRFKGKSILDLNLDELNIAYDELNAVIWGYHKADPENARVQFAGIFRDYDAYIRELDAILEAAAPGDQGGREKRQKRP